MTDSGGDRQRRREGPERRGDWLLRGSLAVTLMGLLAGLVASLFAFRSFDEAQRITYPPQRIMYLPATSTPPVSRSPTGPTAGYSPDTGSAGGTPGPPPEPPGRPVPATALPPIVINNYPPGESSGGDSTTGVITAIGGVSVGLIGATAVLLQSLTRWSQRHRPLTADDGEEESLPAGGS